MICFEEKVSVEVENLSIITVRIIFGCYFLVGEFAVTFFWRVHPSKEVKVTNIFGIRYNKCH